MKAPRSLPAAVVAAASLVACSIHAGWSSDSPHVRLGDVTVTRPLDPGVETIVIRNNAGDIHARMSETDGVRAAAVVYHREGGSTIPPDGVVPARDLVWSVEGTTLTIGNGHLDAADSEDWRLDLDVAIPEGLALRVATGAGKIDLDGRWSEVAVESGAGSIHLQGEADQVNVEVGAGSIHAGPIEIRSRGTFSNGAGKIRVVLDAGVPARGLEAESGAGKVEILLPPGTGANFQLETGVGGVSFPDTAEVAESSHLIGGSAAGKIAGGGPEIHASSGVGAVGVRIR